MCLDDRHATLAGGSSSNNKSRIPSTLQNVFLASNRGIDVHVPPPKRAGNRTFFRGRLARAFSFDSPDALGGRSNHGTEKNGRFFSLRRGSNDNISSAKTEKSGREALSDLKGSSHSLDGYPRSAMKKKPSTTPSISPQQYLDALIEARGYCTQSFEALESAYHSRPSPLQVASYGTWIVDVVKKRDSEGLKTALACGLSSNACNTYGESLIHRVCRLGERTLLEILLEAGCDLQVADDYGRTPLHDACWSPEPSFDLVELILKRDVRLLYISDARGALPLSYVRKEHWSQWLKFLATNKDVFWPRASSDDQRVPPLLTLQKPNSKPVPAPKVSLSLELAAMVANGKMSPMEAIFLLSDDSQVEDGNNEDEESDESSEDDSDDSSDNEEVNDEDSWNEDEMNEILNSLNTGKAAPLSWSR